MRPITTGLVSTWWSLPREKTAPPARRPPALIRSGVRSPRRSISVCSFGTVPSAR
jgi:hypothetical protein